jgi:hypothetical protein
MDAFSERGLTFVFLKIDGIKRAGKDLMQYACLLKVSVGLLPADVAELVYAHV